MLYFKFMLISGAHNYFAIQLVLEENNILTKHSEDIYIESIICSVNLPYAKINCILNLLEFAQ